MKKTVVISCAGKGSRLGFDLPKCLVEVNKKSILERDLEVLEKADEIIIVVGYKGAEVIKKLEYLNKKYKRNVKVVWNHNYENTATGASFTIGAKASRNEFVIAFDGDMIVHPADIQTILNEEEEFVCGEIPHTDNPVYMKINDEGQAVEFSKSGGGYYLRMVGYSRYI